MKLLFVRFALFVLLFLIQTNVFGQGIETYIKENAIEINSLARLEDSLYKHFSKTKVTMIGELHGTNESADFAKSLTNLLTKNNDSVLFGIEICADKQKNFNITTLKNILLENFLKDSSNDWYNSSAWFKLITTQLLNKKVKLFFFDETKEQRSLNYDRDSSMYLNIKSEMQKNPKFKVILLSGNIHNKLKSYRNIKRVGYHLLADKELALKNQIRSINISYEKATMLNNDGSGLKLKTNLDSESPFAKATNYFTYLLFFPIDYDYDYNGILFKKNITEVNRLDK